MANKNLAETQQEQVQENNRAEQIRQQRERAAQQEQDGRKR